METPFRDDHDRARPGAGDDLGMVTVSIPRARRLARPGQHAPRPCRPRPWLHLVTMAVPQARAR
jgi:hypothetical protein